MHTPPHNAPRIHDKTVAVQNIFPRFQPPAQAAGGLRGTGPGAEPPVRRCTSNAAWPGLSERVPTYPFDLKHTAPADSVASERRLT
jgi:hypothetical protein